MTRQHQAGGGDLLEILRSEAEDYHQARGKWRWYRMTFPSPKCWKDAGGGDSHRLTPQGFALAFERWACTVSPKAVSVLVACELRGMGYHLAAVHVGLSWRRVMELLKEGLPNAYLN